MTQFSSPFHAAARPFALLIIMAGLVLLFTACQEPVAPTATSTVTPTSTPREAPTQTPPRAQPVIPAPRDIVFPDDEARHADPLEWWYYHGTLEDENGGRYGFHFVIFQARQPESDFIAYQAHAAVTDIASRTHEEAVRFALNEQPQPETGFAFDIGGWTLNGDAGQHAFAAATDTYSIDISVQATRPHTLHDGDGFLIGLDGWTYYYSWTRMDATGVLTMNEQDLTVTGEVWMDHQWGDFVVRGNPAGWQWFGVRLDNGVDIMVVETRSVEGQVLAFGTMTDANNVQTQIHDDDIMIQELSEWRSAATSGVYPAGWRVVIPRHGVDMTLTPVLDDQEFTLTFPPSNNYWEGLAESEITFNGEAVEGRAYVELVGYVPNADSN